MLSAPADPSTLLQQAGSPLELRQSTLGVAYHLDGKPVANGDIIEVRFLGGLWLRGYFYWSGKEARWPGIRCPLGGPWEQEGRRPPSGEMPMAVMTLPPATLVRRARAGGSPL